MTTSPNIGHAYVEHDTIGRVSAEGRRQARRSVVERMAELGMNRKELANRANINRNTIQTFLDGTTWPRESTLAQIDEGLGWKPGTLKQMALRVGEDPERSGQSRENQPTSSHGEAWLPLIPADERRKISSAEWEEIVAAGRAEALRRWREIEMQKLQRAGVQNNHERRTSRGGT